MLNNQKGLSLMEVVAAMAVMGILMMAIGGGLNESLNSSGYTKHYTYATDDAKKMIEQARYIAETVGTTGAGSVTDASYWSNNSNSGWLQTANFSTLPNVLRTITFPAGTSGDPVQVKATVQWNEGRGAVKNYSIETLITKRSE